ncbi:MAG: diacylglycerol kinase [Patescibacteria group bacterium]
MLRQFFKSFGHAVRGIIIVFKEEQSFRVQVLAAFIVLALMFVFPLNIVEKSILILLIIIVLALEMLNSVLERFIDVFKPRVHEYIKDIKDIAAGAVFISSLGSFLIGIIIFYPHVYILIKDSIGL